MPSPLSSPKPVQAPAVGPGTPRQGQGEARRMSKDSLAQLLPAGEHGVEEGLFLATGCLPGRGEGNVYVGE